MLRISARALQSYVNQLRNLRRDKPQNDRFASRRSAHFNSVVADSFVPSQERYDAWFTEVYGIAPTSDEAVSATPSNTHLDDSKAIQNADEFDEAFQQGEASFWHNEFSAAELQKRSFD
jgi:hypothetical protein